MPLGKLGKYERVDVLGHGVSGIVYLAWDTLLKKQIALKQIDLHGPDVSRFLEEARVMDRLRHPNIVRVNNVDLIDGHVIIDMEYVKGPNLQEVLRREGRLAPDRALNIAIQTLDALDYAHSLRTVHRDIKPANILVGRDDEVKLVDFGLAEILATNSYAGGAGTYAYMAPEDFAEEHHSDHLSDIWAVGVTLFEMLTASRPFTVAKAKDPFAWRRVLLNDDPARLTNFLDHIPEGLQTSMDRALARDKRDRYQTAGAFRDDLIAVSERRFQAVVAVQIPALAVAVASNGSAVRAAFSPERTMLLPPRESAPLPAPAADRTVAIAPPAEQKPGRLPSLLRRRELLPARVEVEPQAIFLGEVRKGDERAGRITVKLVGGDGKPTATVTAAPPWISVSPAMFARRKQSLTITAHSEYVWQTGSFEDEIKLETSAGPVTIPVALRVLPARPRFSDVATWFLPLFFATMLPAMTVAFLTRFHSGAYLVPAASLASGLLAAMLLAVSVAADLGVGERIASGLMIGVMSVVLGMAVGVANRTGNVSALLPLMGTGVPIGVMLFLQLATRRHWKLWSGAIACLGLLASYTFLSVAGQ